MLGVEMTVIGYEIVEDFNKHTSTSTTSTTHTSSSSYAHDDDGDCVMLDGDPDTPALEIHNLPDQLLLVGEKG